MQLVLMVALKHVVARKRQSLVSVAGIVLGVGFFLAICSLMLGSERDFVHRLVDNTPHITVLDEYRNPRLQPVDKIYPRGAVALAGVKPPEESRGIRQFRQGVGLIAAQYTSVVAPVLLGQALLNFAGRDVGLTVNGMDPREISEVTTIRNYMVAGQIENLITNPNGIIIGQELARTMGVAMGDNLLLTSTSNTQKYFKVEGFFRTGRSAFDLRQAYGSLKQIQVLLDRPNRVNRIIMKIRDPYQARRVAAGIEAQLGYKAVSWQEESEDLLNTLVVRNVIMYTVVSAVLLVAAFGIYNVISTVVLEKQRDIAILRSMGFQSADIRSIFLWQGIVLGVVGSAGGLPFGSALMYGLSLVKFQPPGVSEPIFMPIDWGWPQFVIATAFAMFASVTAAVIPARKAALFKPIDILRGNR